MLTKTECDRPILSPFGEMAVARYRLLIFTCDPRGDSVY